MRCRRLAENLDVVTKVRFHMTTLLLTCSCRAINDGSNEHHPWQRCGSIAQLTLRQRGSGRQRQQDIMRTCNLAFLINTRLQGHILCLLNWRVHFIHLRCGTQAALEAASDAAAAHYSATGGVQEVRDLQHLDDLVDAAGAAVVAVAFYSRVSSTATAPASRQPFSDEVPKGNGTLGLHSRCLLDGPAGVGHLRKALMIYTRSHVAPAGACWRALRPCRKR